MAEPRLQDVRMPDGTIIKNVPEGTTQEELQQRLNEHYKDTGPNIKLGIDSLASSVKEVAKDFGPLSQAAVGSKALWDHLALRAKQAAGQEFTQDDIATIRANRALWQESPYAVGGALVSGIPAVGAITRPAMNFAMARIGAALPSWLAPTVPAAVGGGMAAAASEPVLPGESLEKNIDQGMILGGLGDATFRLGARAIQPITQSAPVKRLLEKGIIPTIGQAAGGILRDIEEKAQSLPGVGYFIGGAKERARTELNRAALQMGMPPGTKATDVGQAGIENAKTALGKAYDDLYANTQVGRDQQLVQELADAVSKPLVPLSRDYKRAYDKTIQSAVLDRLPQGQQFATGEIKKQIEGELSKKIRELGPVPSGQDAALKVALEEARDAVRRLANRGAGVDLAERAAIDRAYANMKDVETAAKSAMAKGGVATPYQLMRGAKPGTPLHELASSGQEVMGSTVPDSGTAGRALMANVLFGTPTMIGTAGAPYVGALAGSPMLYSRAGQRYMLGDLLPWELQGVLSSALRNASPSGAVGGGILSATRP
jgi:flavin-binding protein dodecin